MSLNLSPISSFQQWFSGQSVILAGGFVYTYVAGDSIPQATYTTQRGDVPNANPIQLDSTGTAPQEIWLTGGQTYKFVVTDKVGNVLGTVDNVAGINDLTLPSSITSGTTMIFQQTTVPVGWTRVSAYDDATLRVVGAATPASGGTNSMVGRLVNQISVDSHVVTLAEFPAHTHNRFIANAFTGGTYGGLGPGDGTTPTIIITSDNGPGQNQGHVHTKTFGLKYVDTMVCFKN